MHSNNIEINEHERILYNAVSSAHLKGWGRETSAAWKLLFISQDKQHQQEYLELNNNEKPPTFFAFLNLLIRQKWKYGRKGVLWLMSPRMDREFVYGSSDLIQQTLIQFTRSSGKLRRILLRRFYCCGSWLVALPIHPVLTSGKCILLPTHMVTRNVWRGVCLLCSSRKLPSTTSSGKLLLSIIHVSHPSLCRCILTHSMNRRIFSTANQLNSRHIQKNIRGSFSFIVTARSIHSWHCWHSESGEERWWCFVAVCKLSSIQSLLSHSVAG